MSRDRTNRYAPGGGAESPGHERLGKPGARTLSQDLPVQRAPAGRTTSSGAPFGPVDPPAPRDQRDASADAFGVHLGQSRPLDPLGQSKPLDPLGQSFLDPSRDADNDGRADLFPRARTGARAATVAQPSRHATQLSAATKAAVADVNLIPSTLLPAYAEARDALEPAALQALATDVLTKYQAALDVRDQVRPIVDPDDPDAAAYNVLPATSEGDTDRMLLWPQWRALEAAVSAAESQLATGLGPTRFRGLEVAHGVTPVRIARHAQLTIPRLLREAIHTGELVAAIVEIRERVPRAMFASAAIDAETARELADRIKPFASRPLHFAFIKTALTSLGLWSTIEHAIGSDGRSLTQLDADTTAQAARFGVGADLGAYKADQILGLLKPTRTGSNATTYTITESSAGKVIDAISAIEDPEGRAAALRDLERRGLLDAIADLGAPAKIARLHDSLPQGNGHVRAIMRPHFEGRDTDDNSLGTMLGDVPLVGGVLHSATNIATFGFLDEHDAAYRAMKAGEITEAEFHQLTGKALLRAGVIGAASYATGGAAGAYAEGLTGSLAARGVVGRIASNTITGVAAGSAGAVGARLGSDAVDGRLSGASDYAHDALLGGAIGGGLGAGLTTVGAAGARFLPEGARTRLQKLAVRFPHEAKIFDGIRAAGGRHGAVIGVKVSRLLQFGDELGSASARGALALVATDGGPVLAPDDDVLATIRATRPLDELGEIDGAPILVVAKVERLPERSVSTLGDDVDGNPTSSLADDGTTGESMSDGAERSPPSTVSASQTLDEEIAVAARLGAERARIVQAVGDIPISSMPSSKGPPSYFIKRADGATLTNLLAQLPEVRVIEFSRGLTIHHDGRDWFLEWAPEAGNAPPVHAASRDGGAVGLPAPNASIVQFYGFRGLKFVDGVYWKELPPDKLAFVQQMFQQDPLLHYGHVGVSFDGGRTIYGLTPPIKGTAELTPAMVKERVENHIPVPGIIGDDTATFERARALVAHGWDLEITVAAQSLDEATLQVAFDMNRGLARTPGQQHGKEYQWPYEKPNEHGDYYANASTRNCATYPEMIGLCVPEQSGQLRDYIPKLKEWAKQSPIDLRSGGKP